MLGNFGSNVLSAVSRHLLSWSCFELFEERRFCPSGLPQKSELFTHIEVSPLAFHKLLISIDVFPFGCFCVGRTIRDLQLYKRTV